MPVSTGFKHSVYKIAWENGSECAYTYELLLQELEHKICGKHLAYSKHVIKCYDIVQADKVSNGDPESMFQI